MIDNVLVKLTDKPYLNKSQVSKTDNTIPVNIKKNNLSQINPNANNLNINTNINSNTSGGIANQSEFTDLTDEDLFSSLDLEPTDPKLEIPVVSVNSTKLTNKSKSNENCDFTEIEEMILNHGIGAFAGPKSTYPVVDEETFYQVYNNPNASNIVKSRAVNIANRLGLNTPVLKLTTETNLNNNKLCLATFNNTLLDVQAFEDQEKKMLKIPAGVIGKWSHPEYGEVEFSQDKFDQAIDNFNSGVLGYEPTLNVGHYLMTDNEFTKGSTFGGEPTEGICVNLYQEGEVLYSVYECFNPQVYDSVKQKRYRRSSAELVMDYVDRRNGNTVGMTLVGMALTNKPFITNMPTVTVLTNPISSSNLTTPNSKSEIELEYHNQNQMDTLEKPNTESTSTEITSTEVTQKLNSEVNMDKNLNEFSNQLAEMRTAFQTAMEAQKAQFSQLLEEQKVCIEKVTQENEALKSQIDSLNAEKAKAELDEKIKVINDLNLSQPDKDKYILMFSSGSLGSKENEEVLLSTLKQSFSDKSNTHFKFTQQLGNSSTSVPNNSSSVVNPYTTIIEQNKASVSK